MSSKVKEKALTGSQIFAIIFTALSVIGLWYLNWHLLKNDANRGIAGDMFGAVNALFSGLAFAGIIFTILLQRNELKLQREELRESRQESIEQNRTLRLQRFENTFFNMLNLQNEIIRNLQYGDVEGKRVIDARAKVNLFAMLHFRNYQEVHERRPDDDQTIMELPTDLSNARSLLEYKYFTAYYNKYSSNLNHYFRHLYHIFKFIYFSQLSTKEKNFYASIARALLSQNELFIIAFNAIIDGYGKPNFLYLIKEYNILQNFRWADIEPNMYEKLIKLDIERAIYPFDREKPDNRNCD